MKYKYLKHTADAKFQAFGRTLEEAFCNAAYAMINITSKQKIKEKTTKRIKIKGIDKKSLLYRFLEEILFLLNAKNFILSKVKKIKIKDNEIKAVFSGDSIKNYKPQIDIKAVTYNDMFIKEKPFSVQVVLDI